MAFTFSFLLLIYKGLNGSGHPHSILALHSGLRSFKIITLNVPAVKYGEAAYFYCRGIQPSDFGKVLFSSMLLYGNVFRDIQLNVKDCINVNVCMNNTRD